MGEYKKYILNRRDLHDNPIDQFNVWFEAAKKNTLEPEVMALATANLEAVPSCRMVLIKYWDDKGFVFFTNGESRKGKELHQNPVAMGTFYWKELERQVIIEGSVGPIPTFESDRYFASRSREAQVGAWASHQGKELDSRETLIERFNEFNERFADNPIPRPPYWEGYRLFPKRMEFWQGRENRLHDRFSYSLEDNNWIIKRLYP